ncbi:hypothetical protein FS749_003495 [Ceratobasidium sp. UAMH 11750]|nr:hypothetical protein FS749_003495 [Ceratobasidium sp. UAMH 11750]
MGLCSSVTSFSQLPHGQHDDHLPSTSAVCQISLRFDHTQMVWVIKRGASRVKEKPHCVVGSLEHGTSAAQPVVGEPGRRGASSGSESSHADLASTVPAPTSGDTPALPADLEQNSPSNLAPTMSTSPQTEQSSNLTAWAGLWVLLNVLSEPTGDSPPPNSSFDGLVRRIDIYENQVSVPEGYERLAAKLHDLCRDIWGFIDEAAPPSSAPRDSVFSAAYSSDEARIVSGSCDNTIRIWDAHSAQAPG